MTSYQDVFMKIAHLIVDNSGGRARLAFNEEADSAHFLRVDEKRLGRDIEVYSFFGNMGDVTILRDFIIEVLMPLKQLGLPESYRVSAEELRNFGHTVFPSNLHEQWDQIF